MAQEASRSNLYNYPAEALVILEGLTGRTGKIDTSDLEQSILELGVIQPITIVIARKDEFDGVPKGVPVVVAGNRRAKAALRLKEQGLSSAKFDGTVPCVMDRLSPVEAFKVQMHENLKRQDLTGIDILNDLKRGKDLLATKGEDGQMKEPSEDELGELFGKSKAWVREHLSLENLHPEVAKLAGKPKSAGGLPASVAMKLANLEPEEQVAQLEELVAAGEPLTRETVARKVAKKKAEKEGKEGEVGPRTYKEFLAYFQERKDSELADSAIYYLSEVVLQFAAGTLSTRQLDNRLEKLLDKVKL